MAEDNEMKKTLGKAKLKIIRLVRQIDTHVEKFPTRMVSLQKHSESANEKSWHLGPYCSETQKKGQ